MAQRNRGYSDIPTAGSRVPINATPQKVFLRVASLEMKRQRYDQERAAAEDRIRQCEERCKQIQSEVNQLIEGVKRRFPGVSIPEVNTGTRSTIPPKTQANVRPSSFTHRY